MTEKCKVCKYYRATDQYCYYYGYDVQYRDDCKRYERRQGRIWLNGKETKQESTVT